MDETSKVVEFLRELQGMIEKGEITEEQAEVLIELF